MTASNTDSRPKVSVVVPVYNGERTLTECLASLMAIDFSAHEFEIVVVDNNSTDRTKEIILSYPVRYVFEPRRGRGAARNCGIANAKGEFIAFTDADCIVTKDWLTLLFQDLVGKTETAASAGEIKSFSQKTIFEKYADTEGLLCQFVGLNGRAASDIPRIVTANALFRKSILEEAGCFDEDLLTSEDTELSWRIQMLGYDFSYVPQAVVYHRHIQRFREFCHHHFEYGYADTVINFKYQIIDFSEMERRSFFRAMGYIIKRFFLLAKFLGMLLLNKRKKDAGFIAVDALRRISYFFGFMASFLGIVSGKNDVQLPKKTVDEVNVRDLTITGNDARWSLCVPLKCIARNNFSKLVALFREFEIFYLNKTAAQIWINLTQHKDVDKASIAIANLYDMPVEAVQADIRCLLDSLTAQGIFEKRATVMPTLFADKNFSDFKEEGFNVPSACGESL